jgi:hypothetical protein
MKYFRIGDKATSILAAKIFRVLNIFIRIIAFVPGFSGLKTKLMDKNTHVYSTIRLKLIGIVLSLLKSK